MVACSLPSRALRVLCLLEANDKASGGLTLQCHQDTIGTSRLPLSRTKLLLSHLDSISAASRCHAIRFMMMINSRSMLQGLWLLSVAIASYYSVAAADSTHSPPIRTKIQASWDAAPLAVQIL